MAEIIIHLAPGDDGSVSVVLQDGSHRREHRVDPDALRAVRREVVRLMESFESRPRPLADPVTLAEFGRQMRSTFLPFDGGLASPASGGSLRLLFTSADPECLNLPWELLPGPDGGFLVADARCTIRRSTRATLAPGVAPLVAPPLRVLFAACAPTDLDGLDYEKEEEAMLRIAHQLGARVHLEFAEAGTFEELRDLISEYQPHVVHLSGHGSVRDGIGSFAFENERGLRDSREAREMADQLFAGRGVRLVFVNGCQTAQAAAAGVCQALTATGHVRLALGWGASIADDRATDFARVFFHELAASQPVDLAVAAARRDLLARCRFRHEGVELLDASFALPQLHAADGTDAVVDHTLPPQPPVRPGVSYTLLGDNIRGLREGFVGRRRQLQRTQPALRSGDKHVVLFTGIGGAGKSTLATRLANRLKRDGWQHLVALRAKREDELPFGIRLLDQLATACLLIQSLKPFEAVLRDGRRDCQERLRIAVELLNRERILLVLDNLESLMHPDTPGLWREPEFAGFFRELTARLTGQGRAILTCRYLPRDFDPAQPNIAHEPMPDFTAVDFFKYLRRHARIAQRLEFGELGRDLVEAFHRKLGATPRFVEQASAILATLDADDLAEQLESLAPPAEGTAGDDLWQLQQEYFRELFLPQLYDTLAVPERLALSRLALAVEALPLDGVVRLAGIERVAAMEFAWRCVGLSLLQRFGEGDEVELFAVYPLQREFLTAPERLPVGLWRETHRAAAVYFRECVENRRENELRLGGIAVLLACLHHATAARALDERIWATTHLGTLLILSSDYTSALATSNSLLAECRHPDLLRIVARCELEMGRWHEATKLYLEEKAERKRVGDKVGEAVAWHHLGMIELNRANYAAARKCFHKSLKLTEATGDRAPEAATRQQLGTVYLLQGSFAAARRHFNKALKIQQAIRNPVGEAAAWNQLGAVDMHQGKYDAARKSFVRSLQIAESIGYRQLEAATWHELGKLEVMEGNYIDAGVNLRKALAMRHDIDNPSEVAATWHELGTLAVEEANYPVARKNFAESLAIRKTLGDREGEAANWHGLGRVDLSEGNYAAARENFGKALTLHQALGDQASEAATLANLGDIDMNEGNYAAARENFDRSLSIDQAINNRVGEATGWHQLGKIDLREGKYTAAHDSLRKALAIRQQIGDRAGEAATMHQLGLAYFRQGDYKTARERFMKAVRIRQVIGDHRGLAATMHELASMDLNEANYAAARVNFGTALKIEQEIGDRASEAKTLYQIGLMAWRIGRGGIAVRLIAQCYLIEQAIGDGGINETLRCLLPMAAALRLSENQLPALLSEADEHYQRDRGAELVRQAFAGL